MNRLITVILLLLLLCTAAEAGSSFPEIAVNAEALAARAERAGIGETAAAAVLSELLSSGKAIVWNAETGDYTYPLLEVEHRGIRWQAVRISPEDPGEVWVISFFPENIPSMAASAVVPAAGGSAAEVFEGSTWQMSEYWEQATGKPAYFRSVPERYLFHCLFEAEDQWPAAALPDAACIQEERAVAIAGEALRTRNLVSAEADRYAVQCSRTKRYGAPVDIIWSVSYYGRDDNGPFLMYTVDIDARSEKVLNINKNTNGLG